MKGHRIACPRRLDRAGAPQHTARMQSFTDNKQVAPHAFTDAPNHPHEAPEKIKEATKQEIFAADGHRCSRGHRLFPSQQPAFCARFVKSRAVPAARDMLGQSVSSALIRVHPRSFAANKADFAACVPYFTGDVGNRVAGHIGCQQWVQRRFPSGRPGYRPFGWGADVQTRLNNLDSLPGACYDTALKPAMSKAELAARPTLCGSA
jgi:hypothetical protein